MRSFATTIAVLLSLSSGALGSELWESYRKAATGKWEGTGVIKQDLKEVSLSEGDKFEIAIQFKSTMRGKALVGNLDFRVPARNYSAKARILCGWDPKLKQIRSFAFWSGGLFEEITLSEKDGSTFSGTYEAKFVEAETQPAKIKLAFSDSDTYVITFLDGPYKGRALSSWKRAK